MTLDAATRQRLLELVYDLLPPSEAAELRERIGADPELARAYAEAQGTMDLFAEAARQKEPKMALRRPEKAMSTTSPSPRPQAAVKAAGISPSPWARGANWAVGLAAAVLLMVSIGGYAYHREQLKEIAAEHMRLQVTGPAAFQAGLPAEFTVLTTSVTGQPMPALVEFALYSPQGDQLRGQKEMTDDDGRLQVVIPANMALPASTRLHVVALRDGNREEMETQLDVEPVRYVTRLALDKPLYQPGETIYYRSLTLSRFPLAADREMPVHFEILDPSGAIVPDSQLEGITRRGVGNGSFQIPLELAGGQYTLLARGLDDAFPEERRTFFIRRYRLPRLKKELEFTRDSYAPGDEVVADFLARRAEGGPAAGARLRIVATVDGETAFLKNTRADDAGAFQVKFTLPKEIERGDGQLAVVVDDGGTRETMAKTIPINLGKVEVTFYPEGGDLAAGLENRVYFTARDPLAEPVHIEGVIVDDRNSKVAAVETTHEGMGTLSFTPQADRTYRLKIASPQGVGNEPELPRASAEQKIVLCTGSGVFQPDSPLEFNIRAAEPGIPLVVAAYCRGVPVGQQTLVTRVDGQRENGSNAVAIELGEQVGGVIRLTAYDYSASPPKPVAERLVYRRMPQKLNVRVAGHNEKYSPGEEVKMSLLVTDEQERPVPAALGVAVVDDALLSLADDHTPSMTTHFLLTTEVDKPEDLEDADFFLSDDADAAVALDLLLGTQGWRRFVEKTLDELKEEGRQDEQLERLVAMGGAATPPAVFDNLKTLQSKYDASLAEYRAQRTRILNTITTVSFFAGLGLVLLVVMLGLLKVVQGIHLWVPAVGVTVCCLLIGAIVMDPSRLTSGPDGVVAFRSFIKPVEVAKADASDLGTKTEGESKEQWKLEADKDKKEGDEMLAGADGLEPLAAAPGGEIREEEGLKRAQRGELAKQLGDLRRAEKLGEDPDELIAADRLARKRPNAGWEDGKNLRLKRHVGGLRGLLEKEKIAGKWGTWKDDEKDLEQYRFVLRQYAHKHVPGPPGVRTDFAETLYWNPLLIADAEGKTPEISFELSDSITTFRVRANAHGNGRIGSGGSEIISRIPFSLEPKLPLEVNAGDRIDLPVAVINDTQQELPVELKLDCGDLLTLDSHSPAERKIELHAEQRAREYFVLNVTGQKGDCRLTFRGTADNLADAVGRPLRVVPPGFPKELSYSGQIDGNQQVVVELPEQWVPGSLEVTLSAFPSALADLQKGMEGILREPCGCFEQASTSNYPNVLSLQYMQEHDVANPAVTRRAKELLKKGYAKLTGYECKQKGYEWFGGDPGHEALTAYGLMEFRDMAEVYQVDEQMIRRTAKWLMDRRDGKGGFKRNAKALDSFGRAPQDITDAYVTWALAESGQEGIAPEIEHVVALAGKSDDPYLIALAASGAMKAGKTDDGKKLLGKLADLQAEDGHLAGKLGSITRSGGRSLEVETTALAALAWLNSPAFTPQAGKAVEWLIGSRSGSGGFGSTQATILALKALVAHAKASRKTLTEGKLIIKRDDQPIGEHAFGAGQQETIVVDGLEANLKPGANNLTIDLTGDNKMPYALDVRFASRKPQSDPNCPVRLSTKLAKETVNAGETVALEAKLTNVTGEGQPMTIAILGLPAGLEPRSDQLEELKKAGAFDYYETRARQVICYWRCMAPKKQVNFKLELVAAVPGKYIGPASRAYLYYTSEQKHWTDPLEIDITRE